MTTETTRIKSKLATLSLSLDELEAYLEPLLAQTLPKTVLGLETIQQAKLQTVLPYVVYDLIFIYLKSRSIDPRTHPVVAELDRVRQYFEKITNAENPATKRTQIDKEAAGRFIKQAITQAKNVKVPVDDIPEASPSTRVPSNVTSKMVQRLQYEEELKESQMEESEEDVLDVFEDEGARMDTDREPKAQGQRKGKATSPSDGDVVPVGNQRRRVAIDPFAGYGDDLLSNSTPTKGSEPTNGPLRLASSSGVNPANSETNTRDSTSSTPWRSSSNENNSHQNSPAPIDEDQTNEDQTKKTKKTKKTSRKKRRTKGVSRT